MSRVPATDDEKQLIPDGMKQMITIKPELYAYLIAALEKLIERNHARREEIEALLQTT